MVRHQNHGKMDTRLIFLGDRPGVEQIQVAIRGYLGVPIGQTSCFNHPLWPTVHKSNGVNLKLEVKLTANVVK